MPRRSCFSQKTGRLAKTRSPIGPFSTQKPFLARSAPIFNFPGRPGHLQQRRRAQRASQLTYVAKRGGAQMGTHPLSARVRVATAERISTRVLRLFIRTHVHILIESQPRLSADPCFVHSGIAAMKPRGFDDPSLLRCLKLLDIRPSTLLCFYLVLLTLCIVPRHFLVDGNTY